jgi:ketosteroid isomerase-like protein
MKRFRIHTPLVATATMILLGVALAQQQDEASVSMVLQQYAEAYSAGDAAAVADLFTDDAVFVTPDGRLFEGRATILALFQDHLAAGALQLAVEDVETVVQDDWAYAMTSWSGSDDDGTIVVGGYGLVILTLVGDEWKWHRHVANVILPDPEENGSD